MKKKNLLGIAHRLDKVEKNWIMFLTNFPKYIMNKVELHDIAFVDAYYLSNFIDGILRENYYPGGSIIKHTLLPVQRDVLVELLSKLKDHCNEKEPA